MSMRPQTSEGFTLIEVTAALAILAVVTAILVSVGGNLMDANRANDAITEMAQIYTAVVGDPSKNYYGYIGDTGQFPSTLMDLVQDPGGSVYGWKGPYLQGARVDSGVLYDTYGSPYECYYYEDNTQAVADQFAIISRGPDRDTTNMAASNSCTDFNGSAMPSSYAQSGVDRDNVVYPRFTDNPSLLKYNHVGTLSLTIFNYDRNTSVNALVPGCPLLYTITITSIPRGANDSFSMPYYPGANSVDLPQGLYGISISSPLAVGPVWKDQVEIAPGATVSKIANIWGGLNSALTTPTQTFNPNNGFGATLRYILYSTNLTTMGTAGPMTGVRACSQMIAQTAATNQVVDSFVYPYLGSSYTRRINQSAQCTLNVVNLNTANNSVSNQILVKDTGIFIGIVSSYGAYKSKSFLNIRSGNNIKLYDTSGNHINNNPTGDTMSCASPPFVLTWTVPT